MVILGQKLVLDLHLYGDLVAVLPFYHYYTCGPEKWLLEAGTDGMLTTGFSLIWRAHEYTPAKSIRASLLGFYVGAEYLSDKGWDDGTNTYFKLKQTKED